jgi:hypothetical protein
MAEGPVCRMMQAQFAGEAPPDRWPDDRVAEFARALKADVRDKPGERPVDAVALLLWAGVIDGRTADVVLSYVTGALVLGCQLFGDRLEYRLYPEQSIQFQSITTRVQRERP